MRPSHLLAISTLLTSTACSITPDGNAPQRGDEDVRDDADDPEAGDADGTDDGDGGVRAGGGDAGGGSGGGDQIAGGDGAVGLPDAHASFGEVCDANFECVSGICATPPDGSTLCSRRCAMEGNDCPDNWSCRVVEFGAEVIPLCWPAPEIRCSEERCNGRDDDCDGVADEDWPDLDVECDGDDGDQCRTGRFACAADGAGVVCEGERVTDVIEACDGQDDDCDGVVDNGFEVGVACEVGFGACRRVGETICSPDGARTVCSVLPGAPELETCGDGIDNDCDGDIDEGYDVGATCQVGVGACERTGQMVCGEDGTSLACNVTPGEPRAELCGDGVDNDCDGRQDEGFEVGLPCQRGVGSCAAVGELVCSADGTGTVCDAQPTAPMPLDLCGDGQDNDCDGDVDEGWNLGGECEVGLGACARRGLFECGPDGVNVSCSAQAARPEAEICDGIDNDCDGDVDEGFDGCSIEGICIPPGARNQDGCGVCMPEIARDQWSDGCSRQWQEDTFADFGDGWRDGSGRDLHTGHEGSIRPIHQLDTNRDGWPDLFFNNYRSDHNHRTSSYLYLNDPRGFSDIRVTALQTEGAWAHDLADLDGDGWPELVVSNQYEGNSYYQQVMIFLGRPEGYHNDAVRPLPMYGAAGLAIADLNSDGHLDIAACSRRNNDRYTVSSHVIWGTEEGYDIDHRRDYPTLGCDEVTAADLDLDGHLDLIFANEYDGRSYNTVSDIYWGGPDGPASDHRLELPTVGARDVTVADFDRDGWPDLLFVGFRDHGEYGLDSYAYYGGPDGFSVDDRDALRGSGAQSGSAADLDGDGYLDILLTSYYEDNNYQRPGFIYWGSRFGFTSDRRSTLPMYGGVGSVIADLDGDSQLDIALAMQRANGGDWRQSWIYDGGEHPYGDNGRHGLPTVHPERGWSWDEGNVWDRSQRYEYRCPSGMPRLRRSGGALRGKPTCPNTPV